MRVGVKGLIFENNCLLLVSIEVEELSAHCPVYKELINLKNRVKFRQSVFFSLILANSFGKQQESSLVDYIQLSVMMQYNYQKTITVFGYS